MSPIDFFRQHGYDIIEQCVEPEMIVRFIELTEAARTKHESDSTVSNSTGVYALRNLTERPSPLEWRFRIPCN